MWPHMYLPNDRDFNHIEKQKATAQVFVPDQWEDVIRSAQQKKPYHVQRMTADLFCDFNILEKQYLGERKTLLF